MILNATIYENNTKMFNFDYITKEHKKHNSNRPQFPNHPYRILIIVSSGSEKHFY